VWERGENWKEDGFRLAPEWYMRGDADRHVPTVSTGNSDKKVMKNEKILKNLLTKRWCIVIIISRYI
jgi:hypothetical protein